MLTVLFYYTLCVMLVYVIAAATSLSAYFVSHRKTFLFFTLAFIFYFFDVSLVFKDDFVTPELITGATTFWDVGNPQATIITGMGMFLFLWMGVCGYLGKRNRALEIIPVAAYAVLSLVAFNTIQDIQWREFMFYSMRNVVVFFMLGVVAFWHAADDGVTRAALDRHRVAYALVFFFNVCIVAENIYFQLLFDPSTVPDNMWFFAERSPSENMMYIVLAVTMIQAARKTLQLRYEAPPERTDDHMTDSIARALPLYAKHVGLSKREQEVLGLIVEGKDNQNIASELSLSLSTVKVHVHNILKKSGQPDRKTLVQDFWRN
jgi:DNA-binding CsgD family transcriptional regulator